jgi:uncharacterized membrane protein YhaH (DUF805 family)
MTLQYLFLSFEGRINRAKWWATASVILLFRTVLVSTIAGFNLAPRTFTILAVTIYIALFPLAYAVNAKRFHDRNKSGSTALYGMIPNWTTSLLGALGLTGSLAEPNTLGYICGSIDLLVSSWFLFDLGLMKGSPGTNRFGADPVGVAVTFNLSGVPRILWNQLLVYFVRIAGTVAILALYNSIVMATALLPSLLLFYLISTTERWTEPSLTFAASVLLIGLGYALISFFLATPCARFALRIWPVRLIEKSAARRRAILALSAVCAISFATVFAMTFVGLLNSSSNLAMDGLSKVSSMTYRYRSDGEFGLTDAVIRFGWSSTALGASFIFWWAHLRVARNIERPFVIFLRRFSGFADRSLIVDALRSMPKGVPLAFIASRADQARNWDPFLWAFGGLRFRNVLSNLPIQVKTTDSDWKETVEKLMQKASCVIIDLSDKSQSVEFERNLAHKIMPADRIISIGDSRGMSFVHQGELAVGYQPSFLNSWLSLFNKGWIDLSDMVKKH